MMSWCLRNKAIANTDFNLEWKTKRQRSPLFWDDWCQGSSSVQPRAHVLPSEGDILKQTFVHSFPNPKVHAWRGSWSEAEERGAWVLVLHLVLKLSVARSLLGLAALCSAGVYSRFELGSALLLFGQYPQITPGCLWLTSVLVDAFWFCAVSRSQPLSWKVL